MESMTQLSARKSRWHESVQSQFSGDIYAGLYRVYRSLTQKGICFPGRFLARSAIIMPANAATVDGATYTWVQSIQSINHIVIFVNIYAYINALKKFFFSCFHISSHSTQHSLGLEFRYANFVIGRDRRGDPFSPGELKKLRLEAVVQPGLWARERELLLPARVAHVYPIRSNARMLWVWQDRPFLPWASYLLFSQNKKSDDQVQTGVS